MEFVSDFLIQQTHERILVVNPDFTIAEANDPYLEAVGKSKDEVVGSYCYQISHGFSSPCSYRQPGTKCPMIETLNTGQSVQVIHEHVVSPDHTVYYDLVTYPVKDKSGKIIQVVEIWRDITQQLSSRLEKRVKALESDMKRLIQEDRMVSLGKLAASCVHEINNPIHGLVTFCDLMRNILEEGQPSQEELEKFKEFLSMMSTELQRCGDIISGLLSFSRESILETKNVDLNEVLRSIVKLTRHKMDLQGIDLRTSLCATPLVIKGDINQLQQCFLNLVFNAIEAMPHGGRLILISRIDESTDTIQVDIQDTGCGIPEENLGHIFDPFFTTKEEGEGTGLGLPIVYGIVKTHRGKIEVKSQEGQGSNFTLDFPSRQL